MPRPACWFSNRLLMASVPSLRSSLESGPGTEWSGNPIFSSMSRYTALRSPFCMLHSPADGECMAARWLLTRSLFHSVDFFTSRNAEGAKHSNIWQNNLRWSPSMHATIANVLVVFSIMLSINITALHRLFQRAFFTTSSMCSVILHDVIVLGCLKVCQGLHTSVQLSVRSCWH